MLCIILALLGGALGFFIGVILNFSSRQDDLECIDRLNREIEELKINVNSYKSKHFDKKV